MDESGWPKTQGVSFDLYFTEEYYRKEVPVWDSYAPGLFADPGKDGALYWRVLFFALSLGIAAAGLFTRLRRN